MSQVYFDSNIDGSRHVRNILNSYGWQRTDFKNDKDISFVWSKPNFIADTNFLYNENVMVNYLPKNYLLDNKYLMYKRLKQMYPDRELQFLPKTYALNNPLEKGAFFKEFKENDLWLVKSANGIQGHGIHFVRTLNDVPKYSNNQTIIQKYIADPLLVNKKKFDIRTFMLVANTKPYYVFFRHGYVKLCIDDYEKNSHNYMLHLTNHSVQKRHPDYNLLIEETAWSISDLNQYLNNVYSSKGELEYNWINNTFTEIAKDIMLKCFHSAKSELVSGVGNFQLFGFDLMIDKDFKVWLIEINWNPALSTPCRVHKPLMPSVIKDVIDIVIDCHNKVNKRRQLFPVIQPKFFKVLYLPSPLSQVRFFEKNNLPKHITHSTIPSSKRAQSASPPRRRFEIESKIPVKTIISSRTQSRKQIQINEAKKNITQKKVELYRRSNSAQMKRSFHSRNGYDRKLETAISKLMN